MKVRDWNGVARFGLPGLILGVAVSWIGGARGPDLAAQTAGGEVPGQASPPPRAIEAGRAQPNRPVVAGEAGGTLAFVTTSQGMPGQWLYLIDPKAQALAVYRFDPSNPKGSLKLEAARQYEWDLKLEHYNNMAPEPSAIEATVKALSQPGRTTRDR
ncbi:hypothetical protein [Planctomyces sp. SH-PL62]|uniref:hypothetical protein n=1 Tax=Planctomyces sp. SH-PL62 TaxID=1636152 RepID=UPI00078CB3E2|nr:hypothetical protein [Planctomyces sp. SH-PL62]AMV38808.1 hypothetical protein VT85_15340 [Planctomyces sp. SH-PL62]